jgi:prolyl-tRNA synthetase
MQVAQVTAASEAEVTTHLGVRPGFIGPFHLPPGSTVLADDSVRLLRNFSTGAGRTDWHLVDCNWADLPQAPTWGTFRMAEAGQACPRCKEGRLSTATGFLLARMQGASPHEAEQAKLTYTAADTSRRPYWYGGGSVGLSRLVQVAAELLADADGLRWPAALAPFQVIIMPGSPRDSAQMAAATALYQQAGALGLRPLLDDRDDRLGSKFKDADMLGIPLRLVAGKALAEGRVEARWRGTRENLLLPTATAVADLAGILQAWQPGMPEIAQAEPPGGV